MVFSLPLPGYVSAGQQCPSATHALAVAMGHPHAWQAVSERGSAVLNKTYRFPARLMKRQRCDYLMYNYVLYIKLTTNYKRAGRIWSSSVFSAAIPNCRELGLCFPFLFQPLYSLSIMLCSHVFLWAANGSDGEQSGTSPVTVHGWLPPGASPETSGSLHVAVTLSSQA